MESDVLFFRSLRSFNLKNKVGQVANLYRHRQLSSLSLLMRPQTRGTSRVTQHAYFVHSVTDGFNDTWFVQIYVDFFHNVCYMHDLVHAWIYLQSRRWCQLVASAAISTLHVCGLGPTIIQLPAQKRHTVVFEKCFRAAVIVGCKEAALNIFQLGFDYMGGVMGASFPWHSSLRTTF